MIDLYNLCICKHSYREHRRIEGKDWGDCWFTARNGLTCRCEKFKLDNLKYLEECYDRTKNLA